MARVIWKGAISFGLINIPVSLVPATTQRGIDFDWLDKRSMDPVGYKRINKVTGKDIDSENIVRGVRYENDRYAVLSDDEIRAAYPEATQTVDILAFVKSAQIPLLYFDTPYYLAPEKRGEKAYSLLREALERSDRLALASVVMHTKQHLAAVMPFEQTLILNTLRWGDEIRSTAEIGLKGKTAQARIAPRELDMAKRLVEEMSEEWEPTRYQDRFSEQIMELVERKARQGKLESAGSVDHAPEESADGATIIDLAELLKRSLGQSRKAGGTKADDKPTQGGRRAAKAKTG